MKIQNIQNKTIGELKTITEQYKASIALSDCLFKQNYKEKQKKILKEIFEE